MQVFEFKTGKFTPLSDDVLAKFNNEQRAAHDGLASVVAELNAANLEATDAIAANRSALAALREAEAAEAKTPKTSFLNEWHAAKEQYRKDHP
jgi:ClpP class serine protease